MDWKTIIGGRFEIESLAGKGGMGTVFRARDRSNDQLVALKVVDPVHANARFEREASLLAQIDDERVVRYIAHGSLDDGRMYLAMDWLEGTPLDTVLETGALPIADGIEIARRIAGALSAAHRLGVVHRDVKPSNVILRGGRAADAVLVDFGIARATNASYAMTATGAVIGTPAYMAPEQARGERTVDARADIFSLGCVLFECACGRPAFIGEHVIAVLAKILLERAPRARTLRPEVSRALDELLASMLEKDPLARPETADAIVRQLDAIARGEVTLLRQRAAIPSTMGASERRLVTVMLARLDAGDVRGSDDALLAGITGEGEARERAAEYGITLTPLADGTVLGAVVAESAGADTAERVARCACAIQAATPSSTIALATGRAIVDGDLPVGDAIDRAARLFAAHRNDGVWIDTPTASMLESRFDLTHVDGAAKLLGERVQNDRVRTVLGRTMPFVGRDREIALLESTFDECASEPVGRAMLVIAESGIGKSRLQRELVARLSRRDVPPAVWLGVANPLMKTRPHALVSDVLRRLSKNLEANAVVDFGHAELDRAPLLIVLDDLQWADAVSLQLFSTLLARAKAKPLLVLGMARPAIEEAHPKLWEEVRCQRILLEPLLRKASATLARAVLGERPEIDAIVERAEGNALFVEELVRACAIEGCSPRSCACSTNILDDLPPTIAAATEARFASLSATDRQLLRAAAIFGERFCRTGVAHLVGEELRSSLADDLTRLEAAEFLLRAEASESGEVEYVFRHALVRGAAYATLTDPDRRLGHVLAADWLEKRGDDDAIVLHHRKLSQ